ncbi:hypothetical protein OPU71_16815 [Niveibacterium sp. 24ML]|uniref:hypothetical protein n=1 Tax=Niveibacterium sp. 24ML TaxID=2985512 RepID=UPI0022716D33|nr:hypothetical protein [Niveibacterium sp. 24ML]MCX9157787.1 hypothetical protein [Niveibacterium sp. 24ML]
MSPPCNVMNRDNLYAAPRAVVRDDSLAQRRGWVEWGGAALRALLDLVILFLMLLALTTVFDLLQGEPHASWLAPAAFIAGWLATIWLRQCLVALEDGAPVQGHWRVLR